MQVQPGDVLCTRSPKGLPAYLIRLGAALLDRPNTVNHVIIAHHVDKAGVYWGIEGRPGGVGWVDLGPILKQPYTISNAEQPKNTAQRAAIAGAAKQLLGTPYDWLGIAGDALNAARVESPWDDLWEKGLPSHVVCSSAADWLYEHAGLASPGKDRNCTPGDWAAFITERGWA